MVSIFYNYYMNNTYKEIWNEIKQHNSITICTHKNPDGDTIGTAVALKYLILENIENVEVKISGDISPANLEFIDETEEVSDEYFNNSQVIVVDTSTKERIWDKRVVTEEAIKIDHHPKENKWKLEIGGDDWAACGEHVYLMIKELDLKYNSKVLDAIFVAIWTDTSGLKFRSITSTTKEAYEFSKANQDFIVDKLENNSKLKKVINKVDNHIKIEGNVTSVIVTDFYIDNSVYRGVIDYLLSKLTTEVLIVYFKQQDGGYRSSVRSKGSFDAGTFAKERGGGGHFSSAGLAVKSIDEFNSYIKEINSMVDKD